MAEAQWISLVFADDETQQRFVDGIEAEGLPYGFGAALHTTTNKPVRLNTHEGASGPDAYRRLLLTQFVQAVEKRTGIAPDAYKKYDGPEPERWHPEFPGYPGRPR